MLDKKQITDYLNEINECLKDRGIKGEIGVCGGAAMILAFNARKSTKDIDAIFEPSPEIRQVIQDMAQKHSLPHDWLNDGVKGFLFTQPEENDYLQLSNLRVWCPSPEYLLSMKCCSARMDSHDAEDIAFLINHLKIDSIGLVFDIVGKYTPRHRIPAKTQFAVEEIFEKLCQKHNHHEENEDLEMGF